MRRWLFNILAAVSLLLCLATLVFWARSYKCEDGVGYNRKRGEVIDFMYSPSGGCAEQYYYCGSCRGSVFVGSSKFIVGPHPGAANGIIVFSLLSRTLGWTTEVSPISPPNGPPFLGFGFDRGRRTFSSISRDQWWEASLPHWSIALLTGPLPLRRLLRIRRQRRRRRLGLCLTCGYDLRATPDRCPECGTPIPANTNRPSLEYRTPNDDARPPASSF